MLDAATPKNFLSQNCYLLTFYALVGNPKSQNIINVMIDSDITAMLSVELQMGGLRIVVECVQGGSATNKTNLSGFQKEALHLNKLPACFHITCALGLS